MNPLLSIATGLCRRRATKRYLRRLPPLLRGDYGHRGPYTPEQVVSTIRRHRVGSPRFAPYAMAIFADREAVEALWRQTGARFDYDRIRREIGDAHFAGDAGFTPEDAARHWGETGEGAGHHASDGGSHDGPPHGHS
ncbi:DUF6559 family protein [Caulobacter sp. KR2-114]|uniref:DUF6559 family protein n=1 Tax=Caulobacter sp. KR2-114 TaxID=3400912 RepID=UPI003C11AB09